MIRAPAWLGAAYDGITFEQPEPNTSPGRFDWSFADEVLPAMKDLGIQPILDLCHFGMPDWLSGVAPGLLDAARGDAVFVFSL